MTNSIQNFFKLIGIMYISISLKNLLQITFGTLTGYSGVTKPYRLINLNDRSNLEAKLIHLKLIFLYDYILFALFFYFWIFAFLLLCIRHYGNRLKIHILYFLIVYLLVITSIDPFHYNFLFILIMLIVGYANWWMFRRWIKFK